jgi:hypothetical protein
VRQESEVLSESVYLMMPENESANGTRIRVAQPFPSQCKRKGPGMANNDRGITYFHKLREFPVYFIGKV